MLPVLLIPVYAEEQYKPGTVSQTLEEARITANEMLLQDLPVLVQEESKESIPVWMKFVFTAWLSDEVNEIEVLNAIKYLVETDIILIENTKLMSTELEKEYEAKLDEQTAKLRQERQNDSQEWGTLSGEYDQKLTDERKRYDDMVEEKGIERRQQIQELEDKNRELEITNGELESRNRYLEQQLK